jgi:hypothetical protein
MYCLILLHSVVCGSVKVNTINCDELFKILVREVLPSGVKKHSGRCSLTYSVLIAFVRSRVARFFLVRNTKTGKYITSYRKLYQLSIKYNKRP